MLAQCQGVCIPLHLNQRFLTRSARCCVLTLPKTAVQRLPLLLSCWNCTGCCDTRWVRAGTPTLACWTICKGSVKFVRHFGSRQQWPCIAPGIRTIIQHSVRLQGCLIKDPSGAGQVVFSLLLLLQVELRFFVLHFSLFPGTGHL